ASSPRPTPDVRPVPSAGIPPRRTARPGSAPDRPRAAPRATARDTRRWSSESECSFHGSFEDGIDEATRCRPRLRPLAGHGTAERRYPVVAARRATDRRVACAVEQTAGGQVAQHGIQRALFATERPIRAALEPLGDLISVQRLFRLREHDQQDQRHRAGTKLLLELLQMAFGIHGRRSFALATTEL